MKDLLDSYELDHKLLTKWVAAIILVGAVLLLVYTYMGYSEPEKVEDAFNLGLETTESGELILKANQNNTGIEGVEITVDDRHIGETGRHGELELEDVGREFEVEAVKNNKKVVENFRLGEVEYGQTQINGGFTGFDLHSQLEKGETTRITVYQDGERVGNQQIRVNGETVGQTTQAGTITINVPNMDQVEIEAGNISETFTVQGEATPRVQILN